MNTRPEDSSPSSSPPVSTPVAVPARAPSRLAAGLGWLALLLGAVALTLAGLLWQRMSLTQEEMARRARDTQDEVVRALQVASQAEALSQELQARLTVAEVRLSEVSLQRSQLEELMLSLSRSRDDNLVHDLEATLRLAVQQAQLTGSAQALVSALQAADQRIARAAQPRLNPVQRAIARDIDRIRSAALADVPGLALQMDELVRQVDSWPVANAVGMQPPAAESASPVTGGLAAEAADPAADAASASGWERFSTGWTAWWRRVVTDVTHSTRDLVRVSRIDQPDAALLAPEQAFFLRENIKLKLLNARLALLARQIPASRADVIAVEAAVQRYFDVGSPTVVGALDSLQRLHRDLVGNDMPRPDDTLAALAAAAGGR